MIGKFIIFWLALGLAMLIIGFIVTTMIAVVGLLIKLFKRMHEHH